MSSFFLNSFLNVIFFSGNHLGFSASFSNPLSPSVLNCPALSGSPTDSVKPWTASDLTSLPFFCTPSQQALSVVWEFLKVFRAFSGFKKSHLFYDYTETLPALFILISLSIQCHFSEASVTWKDWYITEPQLPERTVKHSFFWVDVCVRLNCLHILQPKQCNHGRLNSEST